MKPIIQDKGSMPPQTLPAIIDVSAAESPMNNDPSPALEETQPQINSPLAHSEGTVDDGQFHQSLESERTLKNVRG